MSAAPFSQTSSQSPDPADLLAAGDNTPVFALKELVARLNREQYKVQDLLSSLGFALRSFKNLNQFLELIPLIATRVADADGGALVLFRPNGQVRLEQLHCQELGDHRCQVRPIRQALELSTRKVTGVLTANKDRRPEFDHSAIALLDKTVADALGPAVRVFGASILVNEVERGRLYAFCCAPDFTWTSKRQKLVRLVADQTAVAIDNADLTVELRKKERLDRELEIGAEIQLRLLPRQYPKIQGVDLAACCQTADRVGGDYYDFIPVCRNGSTNLGRNAQTKLGGTETTPWSIAIGDVMGKGVPAGLIMTMTRGMLRAEVLNGHSPARILHHLNRVMYADLENSHRFVTLFYSEYDPKTHILSYSNAAHNPPLLWQAQHDRIVALDTEGMLIGLDANSEFNDAQIQLYPGDTIVFFTDGFTDAADPRGQRFEEDRLRDGFYWACHNYDNAQGILNHLFDRVQEFVGPENRRSDDMTAIVLRITQEPQLPELPRSPLS